MMTQKIITLILFAATGMIITGCASISSQSRYNVDIKTNAKSKLSYKVLDVDRQINYKADPTTNKVYGLESRRDSSWQPSIFAIYVEGDKHYPKVKKLFGAHGNGWNSFYLNVSRGANPGMIPILLLMLPCCLIDSYTGCLYNIPEEVFIDMEIMREAKEIGVREWLNSGQKDSGIMIATPEHNAYAFVIPNTLDRAAEYKKAKPSINSNILTIECKKAKTPFKIFNGKGEFVHSGLSPAKVSVVAITEKFFVVFHIEGAGFLVRAVPANPANAQSLFFKLAIDHKKLHESILKFRKKPEDFYIAKIPKNK